MEHQLLRTASSLAADYGTPIDSAHANRYAINYSSRKQQSNAGFPGSLSVSGNSINSLHHQQAMLPSTWVSADVRGLNNSQIPDQASPLAVSENGRYLLHRPQGVLSPKSDLPMMGLS